jgi:hypothetical protein
LGQSLSFSGFPDNVQAFPDAVSHPARMAKLIPKHEKPPFLAIFVKAAGIHQDSHLIVTTAILVRLGGIQ